MDYRSAQAREEDTTWVFCNCCYDFWRVTFRL